METIQALVSKIFKRRVHGSLFIGTIKFCRKSLLILIKAFEFKDPKLNIEPKPFDTAFWITEGFNENDFYDIARSCDNDDIIEHVQLVDQFTHPKTGKVRFQRAGI